MTLLEEYAKYHNARTDAEINFGTILFLQLIGSIMGTHCHNNLAPRIVHHNIYSALVGKSSRSRKTTVQDLVKFFSLDEDCHPNAMSPEQLLQELADNPGNMWWYGEWSTMLKRIDSNHYLSDIIEIMNDIFDCPQLFRRKIKGRGKTPEEISIRYPHLSFNTTITEEVLIKLTNDEMVEGGFFARFIMAYGDAKGEMRKKLTKEDKERAGNISRLLHHLRRLCVFKGYENTFELTDEAIKKHFEIENKMIEMHDVGSFAGRYSNYLVSIADILLVCNKLGEYYNTPDDLKKMDNITDLFDLNGNRNINVDAQYISDAWDVLKPHLEYAQKIVRAVKLDKPVRKLWKYLEGKKEVWWTDAMNGTGLNKTLMKLAFDTLEQSGKVELSEEITSSTMRNREYVKRYIIVK